MVQTVCCNNNGTSPYGHYQIFTTPSQTSCPSPTGLTYEYLTSTSVQLSWGAVSASGNYGYTVEYWTSGNASNPTSVSVKTAYVTITGLTPGTAYEWKVETRCGTNTLSDWSTTSNFTTLSSTTCGVPANLTYSNLIPTGVTLTWDKVQGACS